MTLKIVILQPKPTNYLKLRKIMDSALREIVKDVLGSDFRVFENISGMDIMKDVRFRNFIRIRKYSPQQFRYAISPVEKGDFIDSTVKIYLALDQKEDKSQKIAGFVVWALDKQTGKYDILAFTYVFTEYRRQGIAKKMLASNKTAVIFTDECPQSMRTLLTNYFKEKVIFGIKNGVEWTPESQVEKEKIKELVGKEYSVIQSPFDNFEVPKPFSP